MGNIKIKQVIANQPISTGGSRCTFDCDIENHHIHTYCKACQRNLPYGTIVHDCVVGFSREKIRPPMDPCYLISTPWWKEPAAIQAKNSHSHYYEIPYYVWTLYLSIPIPYDPIVIDLD